MTEKTDQTERKDAGFCVGMPFAETMEKMMVGGEDTSICCPEIMSRMMSLCCKPQDRAGDKEQRP
jgi:hypothetical protein